MRTSLANLGSTPFGLVKDTQLNSPGRSAQTWETDAPMIGAPNFQQGVIASYSR
jgi:hypothetical protein